MQAGAVQLVVQWAIKSKKVNQTSATVIGPSPPLSFPAREILFFLICSFYPFADHLCPLSTTIWMTKFAIFSSRSQPIEKFLENYTDPINLINPNV